MIPEKAPLRVTLLPSEIIPGVELPVLLSALRERTVAFAAVLAPEIFKVFWEPPSAPVVVVAVLPPVAAEILTCCVPAFSMTLPA